MQEQTSSNSLGERVPKLRFPEFEGAWEEHKISDFLSESKIIGHNGREAKKLTIKLWAKGVVEKKTIFDGSIQTQYYIRKSGQLVYGKLDFLNSAFGIVPPELDGYETTSDAPAFDILNVNSQFLLNRIIQPSFYKKNGEKANGSRKAKRIHPDTFLAMPIFVPPILEQEKIATFIILLDKKIELQKKLIESLKLYKRGLLLKLFPQKGESVPQYRFAGFTDAWEQRKLGDLYAAIGNAFVGTATPYYVEHGHFYLESNNVKDGQINHNSEIFINDEFYEKQKDKWLHTGDVVMVQSGHVGHAAVIPEELDNTAAHALIMFRNPKTNIEPYFMNYQYQTDKSKKKIENITTGNTIKHILASDMQNFVVDVPKYEEQKAIGDYFSTLDRLITLHQRKYNSYKKEKLALLQQMFI